MKPNNGCDIQICITILANHTLAHFLKMILSLTVSGLIEKYAEGSTGSFGERMSWNALPHRCPSLNVSRPLAYMLWNYPRSSCLCNPYTANLTICLFILYLNSVSQSGRPKG